jgi:hypothetical protein
MCPYALVELSLDLPPHALVSVGPVCEAVTARLCLFRNFRHADRN